LKAAFAPETSQ